MSVLSTYYEVTRSPVFGFFMVITFISVLLITLKAMESEEGFENNLTIEDLMTNCGKNEIIDIVNKKCIEKNVSINNGYIKVKDSKNNLLYKLNTNGKIKIDNVSYNRKDSKKLLQNVVAEITAKNTEIEVDDQNTDEADHVFDEVDEIPLTEEITPEPNPETDEKNEKPADVAITNDGLDVTADADIELDDDDDDDEDGVSIIAIIILIISILGIGGVGYYFYSKSLADIEI